ncbi:hypothetical protein CpB0895 [Chlamydia pneumoniae TW-183]|uniref:Uncharacterized protein n=2 Tax=Chlamydia pneumoniae TaxID=83558 RepID=Q9Z741_CHLPN|nr:hypothetical protein [Chlamydia pneumoniae]AAD19003.1 CT724 hypothetical protein [Chlamydia pneumoniae CWL029]AAF38782.1 conserved hypothetical protein [Chlamydia pneumoniae AR39]AAP98823.1 hypothetical protein CpB0895 [Chlamydia pneumoniae TW-183]ACZ32752.1 conserved hypothetical protein [Chlamydia pneumoniae LPCoLN]ETR79626.1 hypothetical protein X556_1036 [Chlamydia pneumoniae B21]
MGYVFYVIAGSIFLGISLGAYCQLYYSVKSVLFSWYLLTVYALEKRHALLALSQLVGEEDAQSQKEIDFLSQCDKLSWRAFLKNSYEIIPTFKEMEDLLSERVQGFLESIETIAEHDRAILCIENFWASKNLFDFEIAAYEEAVEKYLKLRQRAPLRLASKLFRFLDVPSIRFSS